MFRPALLFVVYFNLLIAPKALGQLVTDKSPTVYQLVNDVLFNQKVQVSNVTFNGAAIQHGKFDATATNLSVGKGVILATGDVEVAEGPNDMAFAAIPQGGVNSPGDADLQLIVGTATFDAAVLKFDFIPFSDTIKFRYVFGSEEYSEFVDQPYNDVMGIFISGPGISGPFSGNAKNIALVPGTNTPITVNGVNNGFAFNGPPTGPCNNCQYWVYNGDGMSPPYDTLPQYIQFDGFTTPQEAEAKVVCGETYHVKIAIADVEDAVYDSGIFLEGGIYDKEVIDIDVSTATGNLEVIEGCGNTTITFIRPDVSDSLVLPLFISGSATNGNDYSGVPDSVIFIPGNGTVTIVITAFQDFIGEGVETIVLTYYNISPCGDTIVETITLNVIERDELLAQPNDTITTCPNIPVGLAPSFTGGVPPYSYNWSNGSNAPAIGITPAGSQTYFVTISDVCGSTVASFPVEVLPGPRALAEFDTTIMLGTSAQLYGSGGTWFSWSPYLDLSCKYCPNPVATPQYTTTYYLTVGDSNGCYASDEVTVYVDREHTVYVPNVFSPNNDGVNDILYVRGKALVEIHFAVFDRWGEKVFETDDLNTGWDGTFRGQPLNQQVFVYYVKALFTDDTKAVKKGNVTLLR